MALFRVSCAAQKKDFSKSLEFSKTYTKIDWGKELVKFLKNNVGLKNVWAFPGE